jgi:hypothetical protein
MIIIVKIHKAISLFFDFSDINNSFTLFIEGFYSSQIIWDKMDVMALTHLMEIAPTAFALISYF